MKVLIFGKVAGKGGVQRIVYWLARTLAESNCHVLVISPGSATEGEVNQLSKLSRFEVVFYDSLSNSSETFLGRRIGILRKLKKLCNDFSPDIYIGIGSGWNLSLFPLFLRKHVISIFYEVVTGIPSGWKDPRWGVKLWFDEVVAISPTIAETFTKAISWKKRMRAIPGFAEPLERTASLPQVSSRAVEIGKARAAYFGRLVSHKQAFWLVQQWNLLKEYIGELHIHGTGPDEESIREYIELNRLSEHVKCFGSYPSEGQAYADLLSSYDLTLLPTLGNEGAPLVLMESMACGVPFVAYGVNGIPDYGVDNPNVLIVPPEPDAFIYGVEEMTRKLANGQIHQGILQQYYIERYSYEILKNAWISFLFSHQREPIKMTALKV